MVKTTLDVNQHGRVYITGTTLIIDGLDVEIKATLDRNHIRQLLVSLYEADWISKDSILEEEKEFE